MNALLRNRYTDAWAAIGVAVPKPKAILCISAHWYVSGAALTVNTAYALRFMTSAAFRRSLYEVNYPAPGDPKLAHRVRQLLSPLPVDLSERWGLDHGTWSVLRHVYPAADIPVVQLSIDETRAAPFHYEIGQRLAPLREEGVLIAGSGNLVHNLHAYAWGRHPVEPYTWAVNFEDRVRQNLLAGETIFPWWITKRLGRDAMLSHSDARPLPAAALRNRDAKRRRAGDIPGRRRGRRLHLHALGAHRLALIQAD